MFIYVAPFDPSVTSLSLLNRIPGKFSIVFPLFLLFVLLFSSPFSALPSFSLSSPSSFVSADSSASAESESAPSPIESPLSSSDSDINPHSTTLSDIDAEKSLSPSPLPLSNPSDSESDIHTLIDSESDSDIHTDNTIGNISSLPSVINHSHIDSDADSDSLDVNISTDDYDNNDNDNDMSANRSSSNNNNSTNRTSPSSSRLASHNKSSSPSSSSSSWFSSHYFLPAIGIAVCTALLGLYGWYKYSLSSSSSFSRRRKIEEEMSSAALPLIMRVASDRAKIQSMEWAVKSLRKDEDGDVAHEFIVIQNHSNNNKRNAENKQGIPSLSPSSSPSSSTPSLSLSSSPSPSLSPPSFPVDLTAFYFDSRDYLQDPSKIRYGSTLSPMDFYYFNTQMERKKNMENERERIESLRRKELKMYEMKINQSKMEGKSNSQPVDNNNPRDDGSDFSLQYGRKGNDGNENTETDDANEEKEEKGKGKKKSKN